MLNANIMPRMALAILLGLVAPLFGLATAASAQSSPRMFPEGDMVKGRPANYYALAQERRPGECKNILALLNAPHKPKTLPRPDRSIFIADFLLGSTASATWARLDLKYTTFETLEHSTFDINNDRRVDTVFRGTVTSKNVTSQHIYWLPGMNPFDTITPEFIWKLINARAVVTWPRYSNDPIPVQANEHVANEYTVDDLKLPLSFLNAQPRRTLVVDVMTVEGRALTLETQYRYRDSPTTIAVLESRAHRDHAMLCYLRSIYVIKAGSPR